MDWQSSRGRGCLTRRADPAGFDAAFDLAGLAPGTVRMTATVTTATETFTSAAATTTIFSLTSPYSGVNVPSGMPFSIKLIAAPDTATIQSLTYQITSATGLLASGSFAPSVFQPDGLGHLVATVSLTAPAGYAGSATLVFTATAQVVDANGVPQTATASVSLAMTIQPAPPPITVSFTTPAGTAFDAGTTANFDFTVMAADTFGMSAFYTVRDATGVPVATGTAVLTVVDITLITGRVTWPVPGTAAGQYTLTVTAVQGTTSGSATLPFTVNPAPVVTLSIVEPGPITATAGQPETVNFVIRGLTTLLGAGLTATLTDRTTGGTLSTATIAPETLAAQPDGSFAGAFTFTYPASAVTQTLDTNLTIALAVNNVPVTSGGVEVVIEPAPVPAAVFIVSAPAAARAGTSAPLTVGVSGVAAGDVASLFWSLLDAAGNTAATGNIPTSGLTAVGDHLEVATQITLGPGVPPGGYRLQVTMVTVGSQTFTASQAIDVLEVITLRFTVADGQIVSGEAETVEAVLRPRVTTGAASWFFTDPAGGTLPGFPAGTIAPFDFVAGTDPDGTPVWILHFVLTVPPAAVPQPISTLLQAMVFSETGAPLVTATAPFAVVPAPQVVAPTVDGLNPEAALPDTAVEVGGSGFVPDGTQVLMTDAAGKQTSIIPTEVSVAGGTLSFVVPLMTPAGTYQVAVRTASGTSSAVSLRVMQAVEPALAPLAKLIPLLSSPDRQVANKTRAMFAHLFGASPASANGYVTLLARGNVVAAAAQLEGAIRILVGLVSVEPAAWQVAMLLKTGFEALVKQMLAAARAAGVPDWLLALAQQLYQQALQLQAQGNLVGAMQNLLQVVDLVGGFLHLPAPLPIPTAVVVGPTCILLPPGFGHHSGTALFVLVHGWPGSVTWQVSDVRGTEMGDPGATISHVYGDVMELHVARPGQIQVTAVFQPVGEQPYIVTSLGSDVCHFELSQCPAQYLPSAKRGEDEIAFTAKILPDWHKSFIRFLLPQCSNEPGQCCNWPPAGDAAYDEDYDLEFRKQMPFDPPVHQAPPTLPAWTIRTSSMVDHATVLVHVRDYGAFGRIEARADICGVTNVAAHVEKPLVEQFATIPLDDLLRNGIADVGWDAVVGGGGQSQHIGDTDLFSHDIDGSPAGAGVQGDLLSRYSEYRGFIVQGVHIRTSPDLKDVFIGRILRSAASLSLPLQESAMTAFARLWAGRPTYRRILLPLALLLAGGVAARLFGHSSGLEVRLRLTSDSVCPLDPWGVRVEFLNHSGHDMVVAVPTNLGSQGISIAVVPEGEQPRWSSSSWGPSSPSAGGARPTILAPGGHVESEVLWWFGHDVHPVTRPGRLHVYARYEMRASASYEDPEPTPVEPTVSEPCLLQGRWCDDRIPGWLERLNLAQYDWECGRQEKAQQIIDSVVGEGTPCARRTALEVLWRIYVVSRQGARALDTCRARWHDATQEGLREMVAVDLLTIVESFGLCDEVVALVGDYGSPRFGLLRDRCERARVAWNAQQKLNTRPPDTLPVMPMPDDRKPDDRLDLHVHLASAEVCPFDKIEVIVEYTNRSTGDLVIDLPRHDCSGFTQIDLRLADRPRPLFRGAHMATADRRVRLKPGESVSSTRLWIGAIPPDAGIPPDWLVSARYDCPEGRATGQTGDAATPLYARSRPVPIRFQWCSNEARTWHRKLMIAEARTEREEDLAKADEVVTQCVKEGPACARRAALEARCRLRCSFGKPSAIIEACKAYWDLFKAPSEREVVFELLDLAISQRGVDADAACAIVGDYESRRFGNFRKHCEQFKKDRAAEQGETK